MSGARQAGRGGLAAGGNQGSGGQQQGRGKEGTLHEVSSKSGGMTAPRCGEKPHRGTGREQGQLTLTAVSSTTKLVWSDESSFIRNFTVTALPL